MGVGKLYGTLYTPTFIFSSFILSSKVYSSLYYLLIYVPFFYQFFSCMTYLFIQTFINSNYSFGRLFLHSFIHLYIHTYFFYIYKGHDSPTPSYDLLDLKVIIKMSGWSSCIYKSIDIYIFFSMFPVCRVADVPDSTEYQCVEFPVQSNFGSIYASSIAVLMDF